MEHLKAINANDYCGVAIVSGDGLVHEFVNSFCDLPVTHVPAGSGNAFAKNQTLRAGELCKNEETIFLVIKNKPCKFNLMVKVSIFRNMSYKVREIRFTLFCLLSGPLWQTSI